MSMICRLHGRRAYVELQDSGVGPLVYAGELRDRHNGPIWQPLGYLPGRHGYPVVYGARTQLGLLGVLEQLELAALGLTVVAA